MSGPFSSATPHSGSTLTGAGGILLSVAAAAGMVVGARSVVALELPGVRSLLGIRSLPREGLGLAWSPRVIWPAELQETALDRMTEMLAALFLSAVAVALINALVLLVESGTARRRELAVRAAVGAGPGALLSLLGRQIRALLVAGLVLGLLLGMAGGGVLRALWPGTVAPLGWGDALITVLSTLAVLAASSALAYLWVGVSVGRPGALAKALGSGGRTTSDRAEAFRRRFLSAFQMGMAGAVALAALALSAGDGRTPASPEEVEAPAVVVSVRATGPSAPDWVGLLDTVGALEGMVSASVASPGALVGLGIRDFATAQCGNCYRGGLPLPFWGAQADHHAVAPGFFGAAGLSVVSGRTFTRSDGPGAPRVALVNQTFAHTAFERGDPVGRLVRLGRGLDDWYEVVGVVEDGGGIAVGRDDLARAAVYVSALQHPTREADVVLRGTEDSVAAARAHLEGAGLSAEPPRPLTQVVREARAPLLWAARLALALALVAWLLAVYGAHATTLQVTRRRTQELAVRRVLGATGWRVLLHVLAGSTRTALWGTAVALFFGTLLVALFRKASGVPPLGVSTYAAMATLLVGAALLASARAARESLAVAPAEALE